jgi:Exopolysaccharide biosynthesis protein related to N-acetylglucosamine-1-phosphodiester alpha-N-acetylglucosaminidase
VVTGSGASTVTYYVADVKITDATILRSAFANDQFGTNIIANPSVIAQQAGAVFAVNGDYYGFRETGIVIRNGVAFRDAGARQGLAFRTDGSLRLYDETTTNAQALLDDGVWQTWSFGPGIVDSGVVLRGIDSVEVDTNVGNHSIQGSQPRTGIGMVADNHLLFIAADGRSSGYSKGVTMTEFAQIFVEHGAQVAYNLDGGGSTTMVLGDALVNNPLGKGQERGTSDIIYIAG